MEPLDKRTLIAVVLAIAVLLGYQYLFIKPVPSQPPLPPKTETKSAQPMKAVPSPQPYRSVPSEATSKPANIVKVDTPLYVLTLSSKGGTVDEFELKTYKDRKGAPVSLVKAPEIYPALALGEHDKFDLSKVDFTVTGNDVALKGSEIGNLVFQFVSPQLSVKRTFTFYANSYKIDLKDKVSGIPSYWITLGSDFGIHDANEHSTPHVGPVVLVDSDREELRANKLKEPKIFTKDIKWIAQEDKYFFSSIVPSGGVIEAKAWKAQDSALVALKMKSGVNNMIVYAGPKEYDDLEKLHVGLQHVIDFGFFSILARPLFWILKFFHSFLGNYGWAIVLLTIVVRIPFIPLLAKSQRSMKKMQELQPKLTELREKYKKDPQKMQKETMEMYKKYKVNPVGGCLPMLLQIPVFFALYKVLMIAIELRGAPFVLWIRDLSEPDTLFGHLPASFPLVGGFALGPLPLVMGLTMILQQKMTPTTADPKQNKMMMLMPIIFTFMFLNFASGLVLYWLVNNILSIAQQFHTNKRIARESKN
jgi:YidC/Oxa1 family membrane protein insertase